MATAVTEYTSENNLVALNSHIFVSFSKNSVNKMDKLRAESFDMIPFKRYTIKETDMRVKTASFTTPTKIDLTTGKVLIMIVSTLHENFTGIFLSNEFTENSDGTYTYQCQDMSREYQSKTNMVLGGDVTVYRVLKWLITFKGIPVKGTISAAAKKDWKNVLSGLRESGLYEQSLWGNYVKMNSMTYKPKMVIKNKSYMEIIRDLTIGYMRYVDVYFDDTGILQIEPFSVKDWQNTGLYLTTDEVMQRKFKFDITNVITGAVIESTDSLKTPSTYNSQDLIGLNLAAFFGTYNDSASNPNQSLVNSTTSSTGNKTTTTKKTTSTKKTVSKNKGNPYGTKKKKIWIGADGGSGGFCKQIIKLLKKNGWTCHYSGEGANVHYNDYFNVTKDYQVLAIVDNGFDPATVKEPYDAGSVKNTLKKKGVTCMFFFDTRSWTNPKGMKPYRYGNFKKLKVGRAHDDNYSNFTGKMKVHDYFKKHNVKYCCHPTAAGIAKQFLAGGLTCK